MGVEEKKGSPEGKSSSGQQGIAGKVRRIAALAGVILLVGLYLVTFVLAIAGNEDAKRMIAGLGLEDSLSRRDPSDTLMSEADAKALTLAVETVQRSEHREFIVDIRRSESDFNHSEGVIPVSEQSHNEYLRKGDRIKVLVAGVRDSQRGPQVVFSRSNPGLLKRLFELSVPEIGRGIVSIKAVVREAGLRSKIAVKSNDPSVDPVGACVGPKGTRVQGIVDELRNEKIDVIPWSEDVATFISNALQPAVVTSVTLGKDENGGDKALVIVADKYLPLAIGREGQNARLAAKLTGWHIDIRSESSVLADTAGKDTSESENPEERAAEQQPSQE